MASGANLLNTAFEGGSNLLEGNVGSLGNFFRTAATGELKNAKTVAGELGALVHDMGCTALAFTPAAPVLAAWQGVQGVIELSRGDFADAAANFGSAVLMFPPLKVASMFARSCKNLLIPGKEKSVVSLLTRRQELLGKIGESRKGLLATRKAGGDISSYQKTMEGFRGEMKDIDSTIFDFAKNNDEFKAAFKLDLKALGKDSGDILVAPFRAAKSWAAKQKPTNVGLTPQLATQLG